MSHFSLAKDRPKPYAMLSRDFIESAIFVAVHPELIPGGGGMRLVCADKESETAKIQCVKRLVPFAPTVNGGDAWAMKKLDIIFSKVFENDLWMSQLPSGEPMILVKKVPLEASGLTMVEALRRAHLTLVARALQENKSVPDIVIEEYRTTIDAMASERNV